MSKSIMGIVAKETAAASVGNLSERRADARNVSTSL